MNLERLDGEYALSDDRSSHISKIISDTWFSVRIVGQCKIMTLQLVSGQRGSVRHVASSIKKFRDQGKRF